MIVCRTIINHFTTEICNGQRGNRKVLRRCNVRRIWRMLVGLLLRRRLYVLCLYFQNKGYGKGDKEVKDNCEKNNNEWSRELRNSKEKIKDVQRLCNEENRVINNKGVSDYLQRQEKAKKNQ